MTNPYVLHATAALWSLAKAWPMLLSARRHAHEGAQASTDDNGYLRSNVWGQTGYNRSGARDQAVFDAAITGAPPRWDAQRYDDVYENGLWALQQGRWLLISAGLGCPITWAEYAKLIGLADWRTAMDVKGWLAPTDQQVRRALDLTPDLWTLPANPACPSCGVRLLRVQRSAPDSAEWTVVCTAGCRCRGAGCVCGMLELVEGVGHIWDRTAPFLAPTLEGAAV